MTGTALLPPARQFDITWQAGDDHPAVIPVLNPDGSARDVSGWSARAVVRERRSPGAEVLHVWDSADGSAECGADGVTLLGDTSADWSWRSGVFDLRLASPSGHYEVPAYGTMLVRGLMSA